MYQAIHDSDVHQLTYPYAFPSSWRIEKVQNLLLCLPEAVHAERIYLNNEYHTSRQSSNPL